MAANLTKKPSHPTTDAHKRRKLERKELSETVAVRDVLTCQKIGEVVNITTEGMMILADTQLNSHSVFMFELQLPKAIDGEQTIQLGVDCLWCKHSDNFDRFWTGFQIIDADEQTTRCIETLISDFG